MDPYTQFWTHQIVVSYKFHRPGGKIIFSVPDGRKIVLGKCNCPSTIFRPQAVRVSGSYSTENQGDGSYHF